MKRYDQLTIVRNRSRARDLRRFRELVATYFERVALDSDGFPADWEGAQATRALINRMLPRLVQVVRAADLSALEGSGALPRVPAGEVDVLRNIFNAPNIVGARQRILDVLDMALGVYEDSWPSALLRTVNPYHYAVTALAFVATLPRRGLAALGLWPSARAPQLSSQDTPGLEEVVARLRETAEAMEMRFAELADWQTQQRSQTSAQLADLAERLDFAERMLARRPRKRLEAGAEDEPITPI